MSEGERERETEINRWGDITQWRTSPTGDWFKFRTKGGSVEDGSALFRSNVTESAVCVIGGAMQWMRLHIHQHAFTLSLFSIFVLLTLYRYIILKHYTVKAAASDLSEFIVNFTAKMVFKRALFGFSGPNSTLQLYSCNDVSEKVTSPHDSWLEQRSSCSK